MSNISFTIQWWHVSLLASGMSSFFFRNRIKNTWTFLHNKLKIRAKTRSNPCPDGRLHSCSMCKDTGIIRGKNGIGRECSCKIVNYWNKVLNKTKPSTVNKLSADEGDAKWGLSSSILECDKCGYRIKYSKESNDGKCPFSICQKRIFALNC